MSAGVLDLSLLPPPDAIADLSYAGIKAERVASLKRRFEAAGLPFDAETIEGDPAVVLQEEDAWRELLDKNGINASVRAVLPAFARGRDLDQVAARANVARLTLSPADAATGRLAVMEGDGSLLRRYLASFARPACGSPEGYTAAVLEAWPAAHDVRILGPETHGRRGRAEVVLLRSDGEDVAPETIALVRATLLRPDVKPLTDEVVVRPAVVVPWSCSATLTLPRGPDPAVILAQAEKAMRAVAADYYRIGARLPANIVPGVLRVPNVVAVAVTNPTADVTASAAIDAPRAAPWLSSVQLAFEYLP